MFRQQSKYKSFKSVGPKATFQQYKRPLIYCGLGFGALYVSNLEQAPVSHRLRFMIVPRWLEMKIGDTTYKQTLYQFKRNILPDNDPRTVQVKDIMKRLIKVSGIDHDGIDWQFHVIDGDYPPNAFVIPGGKVFVFTSILPICKDQDGLATVLGHELAHQVCRHTAENLSKSPIYTSIGILLYGITGSSNLWQLMLTTLLKLPASRQMESEADYVGLIMMAKACFDPHKSIGVWERMRKMESTMGGNVPEFLSTHPASNTRIHSLKEHMLQADQAREEFCGHQLQDFWKM